MQFKCQFLADIFDQCRKLNKIPDRYVRLAEFELQVARYMYEGKLTRDQRLEALRCFEMINESQKQVSEQMRRELTPACENHDAGDPYCLLEKKKEASNA